MRLLGLVVSFGILAVASSAAMTGNWTDVAIDATGLKQVAVASTLYQTKPIYYSDDGGVTWFQTRSSSLHWQTIFSDSTGNILVAGSACDSSSKCFPLYITKDRGLTWSKAVGIPDNNFYYDIVGDPSGTNLWTVAGSTLYHSTNTGTLWKEVWLPYGTHDVDDGIAVEGNNVYIGSDGIMTTSSDSGVTWTRHDFLCASCGSWRSYATAKGGIAYAVSDYAFYKTEDYGATWTLLNHFPDYSIKYTDVAVDDNDSRVYLAGSNFLTVYENGKFRSTTVTGNVVAVAVSSTTGQYVIAAVFGGDLYQSNDYGQSLKHILENILVMIVWD